MSLCDINWTAIAAWVQAIGSIGAIGAAIWIGNRQHRQSVALVEKQHHQNVELIELERQRVREESERQALEEGRDLKELVMIVIDPLMRNIEIRLEDFALHRGTTEPLPDEMIQKIYRTEVEAEKTKEQLSELRDVFVRRPRHLLVHGHLIGALARIANTCHQEKHYDSLRSHRQSQIAQKPFNGPHVQLIEEQPFDTENLLKSVDNLHNVFSTVGE